MHLRGVPTAVISARLGHASASFTMKTYVHSQDEAMRDAFRRVQQGSVKFCETAALRNEKRLSR